MLEISDSIKSEHATPVSVKITMASTDADIPESDE